MLTKNHSRLERIFFLIFYSNEDGIEKMWKRKIGGGGFGIGDKACGSSKILKN